MSQHKQAINLYYEKRLVLTHLGFWNHIYTKEEKTFFVQKSQLLVFCGFSWIPKSQPKKVFKNNKDVTLIINTLIFAINSIGSSHGTIGYTNLVVITLFIADILFQIAIYFYILLQTRQRMKPRSKCVAQNLL